MLANTEIQVPAVEAAILRILEEKGYDKPLEATEFVLSHTDIADPSYDNEGTYDAPQLIDLIDQILGTVDGYFTFTTDENYHFYDRRPTNE